jgi:hypothetical protein
VSTSTNAADYAGDFVDWGIKEICGDVQGTWRTLSADEWKYLLNGRKNAAKLMGYAQINEINGFIFLPDDWHCPNDITFQTGVQQYADQIFTIEQWNRLELAGAVFLPAVGRRGGTELLNLNEYGNYWSATLIKSNFASYFAFNNGIAYVDAIRETYFGRSVRLVHDTIVPRTIPDPCRVVKVNDTLSINMMCVEGGTFMMGAMESDKQAHANEKPAHQVTLTYNYYIAQTEVTQALWKAVMGNNPSTMIGDDLPVNNVLWEEADAFVKRLSQMTGYTFHLPTEAEWEFAARGGNKSQGYLYAGSNNIQEVAWYGSNSGNTTQPVGTKQPNELGIYDMSGNVIEWCSDWLGPYSAEAQVNPIGPATGAYHVYCGGCWYLPANVCRCTHRRQTTAGYGEAAVGLRVALREKVEPVAVDMGLSVKWATRNLGATSPEDYGDYFAWGETEPKEVYSWQTYQDDLRNKYNIDGLTTLLLEDDAAHVNWGDKWRIPSNEERNELIDSCNWEWTTYNDVAGYKATSHKTGNSIFIPAVGYRGSEKPYYPAGVYGLYWLRNVEGRTYAMLFIIYKDNPPKIDARMGTRCYGFAIRPVYVK